MTLSLWPSTQEYAAGENFPAAYSTFADLYVEAFDRSVVHLQSRFHLSRDDAEEIVQTTFLKQWERNPGFVGVDNPLKYVRTIIVHTALDYLRAHQRNPTLSARSFDQPVAENSLVTLGDAWALQHQGMSVEDTAIIREQLHQVAEQLHRLPDLQQVILQMNAAGYSYAEIRAHLRTHYDFHGSLKVIERQLTASRQQMRQRVRVQRQQMRVIRRKQSRRFPGWAMQYAACVVCGTIATPHRAHGKCRLCYDKERMVKVRQAAKLR